MDNSKYINKNIIKVLKSLDIKQGTSKEGSSYLYLDLVFNNGYAKRVFINNESMFAIRNAVDLMTAQAGNESATDFWAE